MSMFRSFKKSIKKFLFANLKFPLNSGKLRLEKPGSEQYGGWMIPTEKISAASIYLAGAGENISFNIFLAKSFNCAVYIFDPAPASKNHFEQVIQASKTGRIFSANNSNEFYDISYE
jgi:hypothetical protein